MDKISYVPVLKWKMGEYMALSLLEDDVKEKVCPLIELVGPDEYDHELENKPKDINHHVKLFLTKYEKKWKDWPAYICMSRVRKDLRLTDGAHPLYKILEELYKIGAKVKPVITLDSDEGHLNAIGLSNIMGFSDAAVIRLKLDDLYEDDLAGKISEKLEKIGHSVDECDLILDARAPDFGEVEDFAEMIATSINSLPFLKQWKKIIFCSSAFPKVVAKNFSKVQRLDWLTYKYLLENPSLDRIPLYGDHGIAHPDGEMNFDFRTMTSAAKIRYAANDCWLIVKGGSIKKHGNGQFKKLCETMITQEGFDFAGKSLADSYIPECAAGNVKVGSQSLWKKIDNTRHITKVVEDLAAIGL